MKSPGGCPTASTCAWAPNADDARWVTCGLCGIERPDPVVRDREAAVAARRVEVGSGSTGNKRSPQTGGNRNEGAA